MARRRGLLSRVVPALLVAAGLVGLAPALGAPQTAGAAVPSLFPPHPVRNTRLAISPVFSQTLVGGFDQAGNTNLDCSTLGKWKPPSRRGVRPRLADGVGHRGERSRKPALLQQSGRHEVPERGSKPGQQWHPREHHHDKLILGDGDGPDAAPPWSMPS